MIATGGGGAEGGWVAAIMSAFVEKVGSTRDKSSTSRDTRLLTSGVDCGFSGWSNRSCRVCDWTFSGHLAARQGASLPHGLAAAGTGFAER